MKTIKLFDIDGTLIKTDTKIYVDGKAYPQSEYKNLLNQGLEVDLSEFESRDKVNEDFSNGKKLALFKMIQDYGPLMKKAFITARSLEATIERWFIRNGILGHFYAVNDPDSRASCYRGMEEWDKWDTAKRKAKIIKYYCKKYDLVEFYDDEIDNLEAARALNMENLLLWRVNEDCVTLY